MPVVKGTLVVLPSLASIQGHIFTSSQVVMTEMVGGLEDIPDGVTAVLSTSATDVLSHVAIRARNSHVLLATCYDAVEFSGLKCLQGKYVTVTVSSSGQLIVAESSDSTNMDSKIQWKPDVSSSVPRFSIDLQDRDWVVNEDKFKANKVGSKAHNLARLRKKLPSGLSLPCSISLPFGVFERIIKDTINTPIAAAFWQNIQKLERAPYMAHGVPTELAVIRELISMKILAPLCLQDALSSAAEVSGLIEAGTWKDRHQWEMTWRAICQVWASKWNDRAWLSRKARKLPEKLIFMGCLLQQVVPAEYAFVVHTVDPVSKDTSTMLCEVVSGLGEVLVGNYPGSPLSFTIAKQPDSRPIIRCLPSKAIALFVQEGSIIARSDSNGEDLDSFSGAGLYDSVINTPLKEIAVDYSKDRLIWDLAFREELMLGIAAVGLQVEAAFGGQPQDIEGVYCNNIFTVVQSRPQIV